MGIEQEIYEDYINSKDDLTKLRSFYNKYNYYKSIDLAMILRINQSTIYRQKQKCGLIIAGPKRINKPRQYERLESLPENWRSPEWLLEAAEKYGVAQISKKAGIHIRNVYHLLEKRGRNIEFKRHKCDDAEWLYEHYVKKKLNVKDIAELADVSESTLKQWLAGHGFSTRSYKKTIVPIWVKELKHRLELHPVVRKAEIKSCYIKVSYKSYIVERYYWAGRRPECAKSFYITPKSINFDKARTFIYEYGISIDGEARHPAHIKIDRNFSDLHTLEKRLTIHSFLAEITTRKYIHMTHPLEVLQDDLERCKRVNTDHYFADKTFYAISTKRSTQAPGHYIAEHFFRFSHGPYICCKTYSHARFMSFRRFCYKKKRLALSFRNFMRFICFDPWSRRLFGRRIRFYRDFGTILAIFRKFKISGTILDLSPGYGYNALAAAIAGIKYRYIPDHKIEKTLQNGFADFVNLDFAPYDGEDVDLLLCHSFAIPDMELIKKYYTKAKRIIAFIPSYVKDDIVSKYKPEYLIPYKKSHNPGKLDYLAIW